MTPKLFVEPSVAKSPSRALCVALLALSLTCRFHRTHQQSIFNNLVQACVSMGGVETEFEAEGHSDTSDFMCNLVLGSIMQPLAEASSSCGFSKARGDGVGTWHRALERWNWLSLSPSGVQAGGPSPRSAHVFWLETLHPRRAHRAFFFPPGKVPLSQPATGRGNGKSRSIPSPSQFPRALLPPEPLPSSGTGQGRRCRGRVPPSPRRAEARGRTGLPALPLAVSKGPRAQAAAPSRAARAMAFLRSR